MTCPRKYCLIYKCVNDLDSEGIEPDPDEDTEQFPAYQPPEPPTRAEQVQCIAGNTVLYTFALTLISIVLWVSLSDIIGVFSIIFGAALCVSIVVAAVADTLTKRATPARRALTDPPPAEPSVEPPTDLR